jgi:GntR family transcriptional regulator of vanillate catabolism
MPPTIAEARAPQAASNPESAQVRTQLQLRELILSGELAGGARIAELAIVERLGVSRTPIRAALMRLEQEGLLEALPNGGYAVRTFTERDIAESIELRGTMEGLLVRLAAERGAPARVLAEGRLCLEEIDEFLRASALTEAAFSHYVALNERFHGLLREMAGSDVITHQLDRVMSLPFASPSAFVVEQAQSPQARDMLVVAQDQHWQVLEAIEQREGARAESVMREHSRIAQRNLHRAVRNHAGARVPGVQLIRRRS